MNHFLEGIHSIAQSGEGNANASNTTNNKLQVVFGSKYGSSIDHDNLHDDGVIHPWYLNKAFVFELVLGLTICVVLQVRDHGLWVLDLLHLFDFQGLIESVKRTS